MTNAETPDTAAAAEEVAKATTKNAPPKRAARTKKDSPKGQKCAEAGKHATTGKPKKSTSAKKAPKASEKAAKTADAKPPRQGTTKATVIAMISKKGGATLEAIMKATGWRAHSVRGFICTLHSKGALNIVSKRRDSDHARTYEVV